jgi:hypothetical protein
VGRRDRRTIVGESANTRQTDVWRTCHRRTGQHEGKGEDQADGPHLTVSGSVPVALEAPVFVGRLITMTGFRSSARQTQNGFVGRGNCFVAGVPTKQFAIASSDFKWLELSFNGRIRLRPMAGPTPTTGQATATGAGFLLLSG